MKRKLLLSLLLIAAAVPSLRAQSAEGNAREGDIDLYRRWQNNERRDSIYRRAYLRHTADQADPTERRLAALAHLIDDKQLWDEYRTLVSVPATAGSEADSASGHDDPQAGCDKTGSLVALAGRAAGKNETAMEIEALGAAFTEAFWQKKDYDRAFYIGFRLEERLPQITDGEYPYRREIYYKMGEAYYLMLDFHKSIQLLENALSSAPVAFDDSANLDALKIIGICYANIGHMDISDEYFRATLLSGDIVLNRPLYNAYALSHLGCNAMLTGKYDNALAMSDVAWPVLRRETNDYGHLAGMCYCRGKSHLEKGDFKQASTWIDSLVHFASRDRYNQTKRIKQAHQLRADYYTAIGDVRRAKMYNDSLLNVYRQSEMNYTSGYIARASQRYNCEKIADREAKLKAGRVRFAFASALAVCCFAVAFVILSIYRKKNAAYKALARKAGLWAREEDGLDAFALGRTDRSSAQTEDERKASEEDRKIMSLLEREMTVNHAYRESGLTMESLAERFGVHRNVLSRAVNRTTDQNFSYYINNYRIKEAVRIISGHERGELRIGELYERVGFTNRSTFYRIFKQFTGISPVDLQKNKDEITGPRSH